MLRVWLREEYGFRDWLWLYPGTKEELRQDWLVGLVPLCFMGLCTHKDKKWKGSCEEWYPEDLSEYDSCDANGHVHMAEDTYLEIDGECVT